MIVINQVSDVFQRVNEVSSYSGQSQFFGTAQGKKQAALGLSWANLVDTRVMLSRKGRDRREISLVYSPFAPRGSQRFIIGSSGIESVQEEVQPAEEDEDSMWLEVSDVDMLAALEESTQV